MSEATISEEQVLHNELSFEINQELIHLMKRIVEIQQEKQQLKEIEKEHQKINGELREENKKLKEVIDEAREWLKYKAEALDEFDIPKRKETGAFWFSTRGEIDNLLQILDKATKENK